MSEQQDQQQRDLLKAEHEEGEDVEGHGFKAQQTQEPKADDDSDEVEAHHHGGRSKA